jgi:hypothetical protein
MIRLAYTIIIFISPLIIFAQHTNFNSQRNWSLNKKELQFGIGATQFNGDLGGSVGIGRDYSIKDIDIQATGFAAWLGYRQRFHPHFATTSSLCFFQLKADDSWSEEPTRFARSLNFRSLCFEVQQRLEFIFAFKETYSPTFNFPGNYSKKSKNFQSYIFSGLGLIYFNPKSEYIDGSMVALRPLKTEGQAEMYSPFSLTVPMGLGFRVGLDRTWRIGLELAYVKTFTDYIDDVSTTYADPKSFDNQQAAYFSNPTNGLNSSYKFGEKRGDSEHKDAYYHVNVIITKNITYKDFGPKRSKLTWKSSGRYKV